jgi:hypothetical protein
MDLISLNWPLHHSLKGDSRNGKGHFSLVGVRKKFLKFSRRLEDFGDHLKNFYIVPLKSELGIKEATKERSNRSKVHSLTTIPRGTALTERH